MRFLNYINEHLIIYLYIIAIIILIAFSFRLCKEIKNTLKEIKIFKTQGEKIKNQLNLINEKTAKITRISKFDEKEWASNVARYEMGAIRAKKQKDNDEY